MNETIAIIEGFLKAGDIQGAWGAFEKLRPNIRFGLQGLTISTRIHFAAKRWPEVDVLCRVLRKEHPDDPSGFTLGAESLYEQGRISDAIELLRRPESPATDPQVLAAIERCQAALSIPEKAAA